MDNKRNNKLPYKTSTTKKKPSYPSIFFPVLLKTTVINKPILALFESASIRNPIIARK